MNKSFKKLILSAFVPVMIACVLPMTSMAAYSTKIEIPVKVSTSGEDVPEQKYTVKLEAVTTGAPMPEEASYEITKDGEITFTGIEYTVPADYAYKITQSVEKLEDNVTLDTVKTYDITVRVLNDGKDGLTAIYWAGEAKEGMAKPTAIVFSNSYKKPTPPPKPVPPTPPGGGGGGGGNTRRVTGDPLINDEGVPLAVLGAFEEDPIPLAVLPMTGDVTNMALWMLMFAVSAMGLAGTLVIRKRVS